MSLDLVLIGETLAVIGKVLVVLVVLHMHHILVKEHKIDKRVVLTYRQERLLTWLGLVFIICGYILKMSVHFN